jgi:hypothetical protein
MPQDLSQVFYDMQTIRNIIKDLSDADLYDQCLMDIDMHKRKDLDELYDKLAAGGRLTSEERLKVESFYILTNVDFLVNE